MADIELAIKISEDVYTRLFDNGIQDNKIAIDDVCEMARALRLGTPLQKRHGILIDSSNLLTITEYDGENEKTYVPYDEIENASVIIKADRSDE